MPSHQLLVQVMRVKNLRVCSPFCRLQRWAFEADRRSWAQGSWLGQRAQLLPRCPARRVREAGHWLLLIKPHLCKSVNWKSAAEGKAKSVGVYDLNSSMKGCRFPPLGELWSSRMAKAMSLYLSLNSFSSMTSWNSLAICFGGLWKAPQPNAPSTMLSSFFTIILVEPSARVGMFEASSGVRIQQCTCLYILFHSYLCPAIKIIMLKISTFFRDIPILFHKNGGFSFVFCNFVHKRNNI